MTPQAIRGSAQVHAGMQGLGFLGPVAQAYLGAAATVIEQMLAFGLLGLVMGGLGFFLQWDLGLLAHPGAPWRHAVYVLLPVYMVVGALMLGAAGLWRGLGLVAVALTQTHGLSQDILERVFERAALLVGGDAPPRALHRPLPLRERREALRRAMAVYVGSEELERGGQGLPRALLRRLKRVLCHRWEARLLELVGQESHDLRLAALTLARVHERAVAEADGRVENLLKGACTSRANAWGALFLAVLALPPLLLGLAR